MRTALLMLMPLLMAGESAEIQHWRSCHTGEGVPQRNNGCKDTDRDGDGDSDQDDFGMWQRRWYKPAPATQPTTQPTSRPCECPCSEAARKGGVDITWQVWRVLPSDLQREFDTFITTFGSKLATRPE